MESLGARMCLPMTSLKDSGHDSKCLWENDAGPAGDGNIRMVI